MPGPKRNLDLYEAIGMNPNMNKFYKEIYEEYGITVGLFSREISVSEGTARASISNSLRSSVVLTNPG